MKPEYMMVSMPHNFVLSKGMLGAVGSKTRVHKEAMTVPGAFSDAAG